MTDPTSSTVTPLAQTVDAGDQPNVNPPQPVRSPGSRVALWAGVGTLLAVVAFVGFANLSVVRCWYLTWKYDHASDEARQLYWGRYLAAVPDGAGLARLTDRANADDQATAFAAALVLLAANTSEAHDRLEAIRLQWPAPRQTAFDEFLVARLFSALANPAAQDTNASGLGTLGGAGAAQQSPGGDSSLGSAAKLPPKLPAWAVPLVRQKLAELSAQSPAAETDNPAEAPQPPAMP